ncbi:MAG: hypothetical protein ABSG65_14030 [Bryobacteraceae bacterium]|jgi:hypothetical protein
MRLEKRIRALEARMLADPVILYFADGTTREICGRAEYLLRLFCAATGGEDLNPRQAAELDLIRDSVGEGGASCAHMTQLIRCFLHGPAEEPSSVTQVGS